MFKRRKGFSSSQLKLTSARMHSATYGTHVPKRGRTSSGHMNADSVGFSNMRKNKRAARGTVDTLLPSTATRESSSEYSRRVGRREFTQEIQRRARVRRIVALAVCILAAVAVAVGVGMAVFTGSLNAKIGLVDSNVQGSLVAPSQDAQAFYTVVVADLDAGGSATSLGDGPDAIMLVRVDEAARAVSAVSIPANLSVTLSDGKAHQLREAEGMGGDAALVSAVASFAGVDIAHFVKLDAAGITALVDGLGGVEVTVSEEVDDPAAGDVYLEAGAQTLDGKSALTLLRASNFKGGLDTQAANQESLLVGVSLRLLGQNTPDFLSRLDSLGSTFGTDMPVSDVTSLADGMRGIDGTDVVGALVPGYETTRDGTVYYVASSDAWSAMMQRMKAGDSSLVSTSEVVAVDPGSFTITVRNGAAIDGGASQMAESLRNQGFNVADVGNTDTAVYSETLVVYNDDRFEGAAQTVVDALGSGRTVAGAGYYTFSTDVLVVLGKDWAPVA